MSHKKRKQERRTQREQDALKQKFLAIKAAAAGRQRQEATFAKPILPDPVPLHPLAGAKSKVERAKAHIEELNKLVIEYVEQDDAYKTWVDLDPQTGEKLFKVAFTKQPPAGIAVIAGEILYLLRSALDHLVTAAATKRGVTVIERTGFPIEETREKFEASLEKRKIKERLPVLASILSRLQPYKTGSVNPLLWWLHWLNGAEKHKVVVAVAAASPGAVGHFKFYPAADGSKTSTEIRPPDRWQALDKEPAVLFRLAKDANVKAEVYFDRDVIFRDVDTLKIQRVVLTLQQMVDLTNGIIKVFETAFFPK